MLIIKVLSWSSLSKLIFRVKFFIYLLILASYKYECFQIVSQIKTDKLTNE